MNCILIMKAKTQNLIIRQPVVVVLGHVDSGKTSILDAIRKTKVAEKESGGITQHIGAYEIDFQGKKITFLDTPGHEAFSQMRSRGARVADIAILVVDAAQGVQSQTKEAIEHIKKSGVSPILAINKIDLPAADPERIKNQLAKEDFLAESLAGKIPSINISASTGQGINELLELILLVAEVENLKSDDSSPAEGAVIEAYLDSQRGPTATLILEKGILSTGDIVATNSVLGKAKILENSQGRSINDVSAGQPCVIIGFESVPEMGQTFKVFSDIESARTYLQPSEPKKIAEVLPEENDKKFLNIILKADVQGSLEAVEGILREIPQGNVGLKILTAEVGGIDETDCKSARNSKAAIIGFRVKTNPTALALAEREKIRIFNFDIIYELVEAVRKLMERFLESEIIRIDLGKIKILAVFFKEKKRQIIGGKVTEGEVEKAGQIEVFRNGEPVGKGRMINLQKDKKDVGKCQKGDECGLLFEGDAAVEEGDVLNVYKEEKQIGAL